MSLPIPSDLAFYGSNWFGRWYVTDPAAVGGFAVSPLLRLTIFPGRRAPGTAIFADGLDLDAPDTTVAWTASSPVAR